MLQMENTNAQLVDWSLQLGIEKKCEKCHTTEMI